MNKRIVLVIGLLVDYCLFRLKICMKTFMLQSYHWWSMKSAGQIRLPCFPTFCSVRMIQMFISQTCCL